MAALARFLGFFTIKQKLLVGFGVLLLVVAAQTVATVLSLAQTRTSSTDVVQSIQPAVFAALDLDRQVKNASTALGIYLLSAQPADRAQCDQLHYRGERAQQQRPRGRAAHRQFRRLLQFPASRPGL